MKSAILFDIDGTLLYAKGLGRQAFGEAFAAAYGAAIDVEALSFVGATDTALIRDLAAALGLVSTPAREEHFAIEFTKRLDPRLAAGPIQVYPGVCELLQTLTQQGLLLGLVTGNLRTTAWSKLIHAGLAGHFTFGAYAGDHADRDELARIAVQRARDRGAEARLLIGDTPKDIRAAHAAGLPSLAVATGWISEAELRDAGADAVLTSFDDLNSALATIRKFL